MNKSEIENLYYGNGTYDEIKQSAEYLKLNDEAGELYSKIDNILDDEHKPLLSKLFDTECDMEMETQFTYFKEGFKAGLRLGIELNE